MGWNDIEDSQRAERIPGGIHDIRFIRVIRGKKDGSAFTSRAGDPQIMLIAADQEARESSIMVTLSEKAAWKLKTYLVAIGADLEAMDRDGVDWRNFADEIFATAQLCDRPFKGDVSYKPGNDGKQYADIVPLRAAPSTKADDIPL